MPRVSARLKISKVKHETLGEVIELYSPNNEDGRAYFITTDSVMKCSNGDTIDFEETETGMGLRLTKKTAIALSKALLRLTRSMK